MCVNFLNVFVTFQSIFTLKVSLDLHEENEMLKLIHITNYDHSRLYIIWA